MNTNNLSLVAAKALPALSGSAITYNPEKNVFLTRGYTSAAGNTYYKAIRLSDRLAVYYDIGEKNCYMFLNGISLFAWNGQKANLIAQRLWRGCNWHFFSESFAKEQSVEMLKEYLASQAKAMGTIVDERTLIEFAQQMIDATHQKQIA